MIDLQRIIAAQDVWRDAEKAYHDEAAKYVGAAWLGAEPRRDDAETKPLTRAGWDVLTRLREAADEARETYRAISFGEN